MRYWFHWARRRLGSPATPKVWLDALGLALFAVAGAEKAWQAGASATVAVVMGVVTATFGGVIRDLLGGESPAILSREIYASAALSGAATFVGLTCLGVPREFALGAGFLICLAARAAGREWSPEMAVVTGIVCCWHHETKSLWSMLMAGQSPIRTRRCRRFRRMS